MVQKYPIQIHKIVTNKIPNVIYGDYASINPTRNDTITMARGWIPRIDVAFQEIEKYAGKWVPIKKVKMPDDVQTDFTFISFSISTKRAKIM